MVPDGDKTVADDVNEKLRELVRTQGRQVLNDQNKFTSLMLDLCLGGHRREINILATALAEKIPQHLIYSGSKVLSRELRANLTSRLENETGLNADAADWAVTAWAEALGMTAGVKPEAKPTAKQDIQSQPRTTEKQVTAPEVNKGAPVQPAASSNSGPVKIESNRSPAKTPVKLKTRRRPGNRFPAWIVGGIIIVLVLIIAIAGIQLYLSTVTVDAAQEHLVAGQKYAAQNQWDRAITEFSQAIDLNPKIARAYSGRGSAYSKRGEYDSAIADFTQSIGLDPNYAPAYIGRGDAYDSKKGYSNAIADYSKAIGLNPRLKEAYYDRGFVYNEIGNYTSAITDYSRAIALDPNYADAFYDRGRAYDAEGNYDNAVSDYNAALLINPNDPDTYSSRGHAYYEQGNYDAAIGDYTMAITLDPLSADSYYYRGLVYQEMGEFGKAEADSNKANELRNSSTGPTN
jgi:Flp pilus assembly protein TadD